MTMHVTQIGAVVLRVTDQDRALDFYVGTLGFEKRLDAEFGAGRWIEVAPPGAETSIALVPGDAMFVSLTTSGSARTSRAALVNARRKPRTASGRSLTNCSEAMIALPYSATPCCGCPAACRRCSPSPTRTATSFGSCSASS